LELPDAFYILFFFVLGSCVGSFLNVVVWRLPQVEFVEGEELFHGFWRGWKALSSPSSYCPKCENPLKWYDNLPVVGWIKLRGRCRFCKEPISARYPIIEAITGGLFVLYYVSFFMEGCGPCIRQMMPNGIPQYLSAAMLISDHWPIYALDMILVSALLAGSLIDAELFIIPLGIPWFVIPFALIEHAVWDRPGWPGALDPTAPAAALAAGAGVGLLISFILWWLGILPSSFADGGPMLEVEKAKLKPEDAPAKEYTPREVRAEMRKEILFLLPPLALGMAWLLATWKVPALSRQWQAVASIGWVGGLLGSVLGLLLGGFAVWFFRIAGSCGFGREAMGLGDVHLMAAVGAALGAGPATVAFFVAPFFGIGLSLYMWLLRKTREIPYGPYLSLATGFVMLFYCPIADYLSPGFTGLAEVLSQLLHGR
jgi:leader peptidase (prepilin peptidase)/N-methyltransferase